MAKLILTPAQFRSFIFGVEDSLVSTVGLLAGITVANLNARQIFLTGVVLIFVEAFSMAAGSFLSEGAGEQYATQQAVSPRYPLFASVIMFFSYFLSGFIPLFPYMFFPPALALKISISISLLALFFLGTLAGKVSKLSTLKNGLRMLLVGGAAIVVGLLVGSSLK